MYSIEPFVIHSHNADTAGLHFDLRVQIPNRSSLASFALPKHKIPQNPGEKVLAVRGADHGKMWLYVDNLEIPKGNYGAGTIEIFQTGKCEIEGWSNNHITFRVKGTVKDGLDGRFALIRFRGSKTSDRNNLWILIKTKEQ